VNVNEVLQAMPGFFDDDRVRLVDRMADERLPAALEDLRSGRFDPVTAQLAGMPGFWGW
jgi:hypothetical protein